MSHETDDIVLTRSREKEKVRKEIIQKALEDPVAAIRATGGLSLYEFLQTFWESVSEDSFKTNWHIEKLCEELEVLAYNVRDGKPREYDLIINVPPGTTKTIIVSIMFPAWCWAEVAHWFRFICASYSAPLSLESAEKSRDLLKSPKFKMMYPELDFKEDKDTKSNFRIVKKEWKHKGHIPRIHLGGNRFSTSVGGTLIGFHGHFLIVDDPINPQQAISDKELYNANHWMEQTLPTRKTDKAVTPTILVMQRLHEYDPSGLILEKKKNIRHICLPGEIANYAHLVKPEDWKKFYKDDLLDPVRMPWTVLTDLEADLGQYGYAGQIGQDPSPPGGGMFKVDHFHMISTMPHPSLIIRSVRFWDKAATKEKSTQRDMGGAYTVGVKMHLIKGGYYVVEDVKRGRWATEERERIIKETAEVDGYGVEVGIEQEPGSGGKDSAEGTVRNLAGWKAYSETATGDKADRADRYSVQVNNGSVRLLRGEWNGTYIKELKYFPNSVYKDQVDASSGAFKRLAKKRQVRSVLRR
jgi:predicted phage terminase large subunit-like protein